jgi:hypothetical protein
MTASSETEMDAGVKVLRDQWQARSLSIEDVQSFAKAHLLDRAGSRVESEASMFRSILAGKAHVFLLNLVKHLEEHAPAVATLLPAACAVLQFAHGRGRYCHARRPCTAAPAAEMQFGGSAGPAARALPCGATASCPHIATHAFSTLSLVLCPPSPPPSPCSTRPC